jgi:hypothetical protein
MVLLATIPMGATAFVLWTVLWLVWYDDEAQTMRPVDPVALHAVSARHRR